MAIDGLTLAPGEAPSSPTIVPSAEETTSVPNCSWAVPLLSGFFSKEAILTQAFMYGQYRGGLFWLPFGMGMLTAVLTPFYMFRIICMAFMGRARDKKRFDHAHESPWNMWVPH